MILYELVLFFSQFQRCKTINLYKFRLEYYDFSNMRGTALCLRYDDAFKKNNTGTSFFVNHLERKKLEPDPNHDPNPTVVGPKQRNTGPYTIQIPKTGIMRQNLFFLRMLELHNSFLIFWRT
jgi:hypothetical protein